MKILNFDENFAEIDPKNSYKQWPNIGLDNDLAPNRRQAIIRNRDG